MSFQTYRINNRELTHSLPLAAELNPAADKNYLFDLSYLTGLSVVGAQAAGFLQGQLSCDLRQVKPEAMRQGALCSLKGRVLALMDIVNWHDFQLILPKDMLAETQTSLTKTAMLSRVRLEPQTKFQIFGFELNNNDDLLPNLSLPNETQSVTSTETSCCYYLGQNFYVILIVNEQVSTFCHAFMEKQQLLGSLLWHQLQLKQKRILIYPETRGIFLPHRLDLHLSGYLSFDKGCYKGQEIVARTHYRAKLKHQLKLFLIECRESLFSGKKIFNPHGEMEVGELVDFSPLGNERYLIAASILLEHPLMVRIEGQQDTIQLIGAT